MSDHADDTSEENRDPSPEGTEDRDPGSGGGVPPEGDATGVYGTAGWHPADDGAVGDQGSDGPPTAVYGTPGAAAPQWATPGGAPAPAPAPQQTAVQPMPGQAAPAQTGAPQWQPTGPPAGGPPTQAYPQVQPATSAYGSPQPAPTQQVPAGHAQTGYAPAGPTPTGGRRWNLWAGVPVAAAVMGLGYLWKIRRIASGEFGSGFRFQLDTALSVGVVAMALLTLVGLGSRKRTLAAPLTFLLGAVMLAGVVHTWYLEMYFRSNGFNSRILLEFLLPMWLPTVLLSLVTMVSALFMRVDDVRR